LKLNRQIKHFIRLLIATVGCIFFYGLFVRLGLLMPLSVVPQMFAVERPVHVAAEPFVHSESAQVLATLLDNRTDLNRADLSKVTLLVEKAQRRLTVFYNLEPVKSYPIVLGGSPDGDKFREGDQKTPEGIYHVRDLYPHPDWSKFIWLDYPTPQDWREHFQAKLTGKIGPLTSIGSEIGIHGLPDGADGMIDQRVDWTWGCVSLKNADVDELYAVIQTDALVEIVP